jgi:hypothetical protein
VKNEATRTSADESRPARKPRRERDPLDFFDE